MPRRRKPIPAEPPSGTPVGWPGSPDIVGQAETTRARPIPGGHKRRRAQDAPGHGGDAKGAGWGGPARGLYRPFTAETVPSGAAMSAGRTKAKNAREAATVYAVEAVDTWRDVIRDREAPHMARIVAADKIVDRAEGKPVQLIAHRDVTPAPFDPETLPEEHRDALRDILLLTQDGGEKDAG